VPDEFCDDGSLVGTPARIRERYRAWEDSGATGMTVAGEQDALELMAEITGANRGNVA
jgi:alkanesulfonate monooxygenase SsuD/methylene tetrahydromethanopterin reductase-like flavin-dependent oxidoreductase (luciferase family)